MTNQSQTISVLCILFFAAAFTSEIVAQGKGGGKGGGGGGKGEEPSYLLTDLLGFPDNGYQSKGQFLTERDEDENILVVGDSRRYPDPEGPAVFHTALWRIGANGQFPPSDPLDLGIPTFARNVEVFGMNQNGVIVADTRGAVEKDADGNWVFPAYVDVPGLPFQELPAPVNRNTGVSGINNAGQIVGNYETVDPDNPENLISVGGLWQLQADESIGPPTSLGDFYPEDINEQGVMVGRHQGWMAVAWFSGNELQIRKLDVSSKYFGADAATLNDFPAGDIGLVVVGNFNRDANGNVVPRRGLAWRPNDPDNQIVELGTFGGLESRAYDVNNSGHMVGWADTRNKGQQAFLYRDGQLQNLNKLVDAGDATLKFALGINHAGDITGFMNVPRPVSEQRGFLLKPVAN